MLMSRAWLSRMDVPRALACLLAAGALPLSAQGPPPRKPYDGKPPQQSRLVKTGDVTYEMGGVMFNSATREVRVPSAVNMNEGVIEYALVTETGKTHESLLKTKVKPFDVNVAMLLCHYEPHAGEIIKLFANPTPELVALAQKPQEHPGAHRVRLSVEWKDKDGAAHTAKLGNWIHNKRENKTLDIPYWIYNGADIGDGVFSAELDGSFISVHIDLVGLIGSTAKWAGKDDNWELETQAIPPVDWPVTLVISPAESTSNLKKP